MQQKTKRRAALLMAIPLVVALTACEAHTTIKINEGGTGETVMVIKDDTGEMSQYGMTCDNLKESAAQDAGENVVVEDISENGVLTCKITTPLEGNLVDDNALTETDDTYIFTVPPTDGESNELSQGMSENMVFTFTIEMPGDIIKAEGAKIDGNRATFESISQVENGITVEGYKTSGKSGSGEATYTDKDNKDNSNADSAQAKAESDDSEDAGISPAIWAVIAVVSLAVIGAVVFFATRKKDKGDDNAFNGETQYSPFSENPQAGNNADAGSAWQPEQPGVFTPPNQEQPPADPNNGNDSGWTPRY